jgi:hypothetical protein
LFDGTFDEVATFLFGLGRCRDGRCLTPLPATWHEGAQLSKKSAWQTMQFAAASYSFYARIFPGAGRNADMVRREDASHH